MSGKFKTKKRLGQNFLRSKTLIEEIVAGSGISENDLVIEIGPGLGALTQEAAKAARRLIAVEIDSELIPVLQTNFALSPNVTIIEGDILETDIRAMIDDAKAEDPGIENVRVIGNLPYYITTPIIMKLIGEDLPIESITIMMQKEVAERLQASPGGKDYGALTVAVGYRCEVSRICDAPAEEFYPKPKVDSRVLQLTMRKEKAVAPKDEKIFFDCVKAGFSQRRKTLANCLAQLAGGDKARAAQILEAAGIDPSRRAETLTMEEFRAVADGFAAEG